MSEGLEYVSTPSERTFFHSKLLLDNLVRFTSRLKDLCQNCRPTAYWNTSAVKVVMWSGGGLTWRCQVGANPIPIPHPTNLALFGYKITLYRFNPGGWAHTIAGGWAPLTLTTYKLTLVWVSTTYCKDFRRVSYLLTILQTPVGCTIINDNAYFFAWRLLYAVVKYLSTVLEAFCYNNVRR